MLLGENELAVLSEEYYLDPTPHELAALAGLLMIAIIRFAIM